MGARVVKVTLRMQVGRWPMQTSGLCLAPVQQRRAQYLDDGGVSAAGACGQRVEGGIRCKTNKTALEREEVAFGRLQLIKKETVHIYYFMALQMPPNNYRHSKPLQDSSISNQRRISIYTCQRQPVNRGISAAKALRGDKRYLHCSAC